MFNIEGFRFGFGGFWFPFFKQKKLWFLDVKTLNLLFIYTPAFKCLQCLFILVFTPFPIQRDQNLAFPPPVCALKPLPPSPEGAKNTWPLPLPPGGLFPPPPCVCVETPPCACVPKLFVAGSRRSGNEERRDEKLTSAPSSRAGSGPPPPTCVCFPNLFVAGTRRRGNV